MRYRHAPARCRDSSAARSRRGTAEDTARCARSPGRCWRLVPSFECFLEYVDVRAQRVATAGLTMRDAEDGGGDPEAHAEDNHPSQRLGLSRREPFARIAPHVAVPEVKERGEADVLEAR